MSDFRATYRLMFGPGVGFREARELVPYLAGLGISHLYLPPSFQARKGSAHGYDVIDPTSISNGSGVSGGRKPRSGGTIRASTASSAAHA